MATTTDYIKLHFIVLLWGATAILGKLISIPAVEMVFYRTLIASIVMIVLVGLSKNKFLVSRSDLLKLLGIGILVSAHWIAFFGSGQISTASVSLVGFATASFWTAILEPISNKKKIKPLEIGLGFFVIIGLCIIFGFGFEFYWGLFLGVLSGLLLAMLSVLNAQMVKRLPYMTITLYEMIGAFLFTAAFLPLYQQFWAVDNTLQLTPNLLDWFYIALLAIVCSVYAYSVSVELMKRISVFIIQLALNLEPVYGIIMAIIFLNESQYLNASFFIGTMVILLAVFCYPLMKKKLMV